MKQKRRMETILAMSFDWFDGVRTRWNRYDNALLLAFQ